MRIILTDSGLGGLSVCADIINKLNNFNSPLSNQINIKYINAIHKAYCGYNLMESRNKQIEIFNRFLNNISHQYSPDAIYIVCNSLSVIYLKTQFYLDTVIPVTGIIEIGVNLITEAFKKNNNAGVIILSADTTDEENIYPKHLIDVHIPQKNIVSQACTNLANTISNDITGEKIYDLIDKYLTLAIKQLPDIFDYLIIYLGCTHYGYRQELFEMCLKRKGVKYMIINPNKHFFDNIIKKTITSGEKFKQVNSKVEFITHYPIPIREINTISKYINNISPETVHALQNYTVAEDLF
jgi:glutamate racemase